MRGVLKILGFIRLKVSECLFILRKGKKVVVLLACVDDLALFGNKQLILSIKERLKKHFKITDLGKLSHFLGVKVCETNNGQLHLTQRTLAEKLLLDSGMMESKPRDSPLPLSHVLYEKRSALSQSEQDQMLNVPYSSILGSLLYLSTRTRPDLSTVASMLVKYQA